MTFTPMHFNGDTFDTFPRSVARDKWDNGIGWERLAPQQCKVMALIIVGKQNKEIAKELKISMQTVKGHISEIFERLNVQNRTEAVYKINQG